MYELKLIKEDMAFLLDSHQKLLKALHRQNKMLNETNKLLRELMDNLKTR